MSRRETFHRSTETPFLGLCGQQTTVARNGHALTSQAYLVSCESCRRLMAERAATLAEELRRSQAENRRRFFEEAERVKDRAALPVAWR